MFNCKVRVLFLRSILDEYGVSKIMFQLASALKDRGHTIVFGSDNRDNFKSYVENMGIRHYTIPLNPAKKNIINFLVSLIRISLIVKRERICLIHSHHRWSSFISYFVSKMFRIPLVTTYHGTSEGNRSLTIWGDKIISVSESGRLHLIDYFKVNPNCIEVIHNGIQIPKPEDIKNTTEIVTKSHAMGSPIIANIARMSPEKDQESLFYALKDVAKNYPEVALLIVGQGPLEGTLKILSKQLGITRNVALLGEVSDVSPILQYCDFVVLSSLTENMPLAILEAFAFGKPVVATSVGDIPKVVLDGITGYLVSPKDPKKLAHAMNLLLADRNKTIEMGKKGRELVRNKFSAEQMAIETENVYRDLLLNSKILDKESI
jgi:glycosyltransferase involved in cell wall biosynthesis